MTDDLAGVKVLDGLDKVIEGGAVVLTLKDQSILADGDINNGFWCNFAEVDMLENVEIGEQKRRDDAYKAAKKPAGVYSDKFNDDPMTERKMLPQYDEPVDEGVTLDNMGHFSGEAEKKLDELRKRLQGGTTNNRAEDLNSSGKILSDYYSQEEMIQFKKPKKKKSLRKKDKLDIKALEQEAISEGLGAGDLGSRNDSRRKAREEQERHEAEMRNAAYQLAYAKADEASKALQLGHTIPASNEDIDDVMADEEDDDLHKSVERARKLALEKQKDVLVGPEAVARLAATLKSNQVTDDQNAATEEGQEGKVVFTEIEEFVWGLQFDEDAQKDDTNDVFKDEDDAIVVSHEEGEVMADGLIEANEAVKDEDTTMEDVKEVSGDGIIHEVPVGKGLSGALKLLHDRGTLKESINWGGRNMDKKKSKLVGIVDNDDGKGKEKKNKDKDMDRFEHVSLERTDEFGRTLTPKEAFRIISHRFHGKGPGKMKQEKRIKQFQEELKLKQMKNSDTPSLSVQRMRETQAQLKTPYLVLSGHVKPGQTSDPRSGFATVEKELPGGLTPMLGDKKVEHFLGIKRKPDAGTDSGAPKKPRT
ncbi:SART-1 family protein DOT2 [Linum perenne]